jgi:hypothetical protein
MSMGQEHAAHQQEPMQLPTSHSASDWKQAHERLSHLAKTRARLDWQEGRLLLDALRTGVHLHLGFGSFAEYVERILGYAPRWTEERLRVAEALEGLPELSQLLRDGALSWSAAREISRVATADNEHAWLEVARGKTVRQIEDLVAGHRPGETPDDGYDPSLCKHVLRFEVSAETMAAFREAMAKLRRETAGSIDDDAALLLLARQVLGGPADVGRANYQLAVTLCERCGRGWQIGRGEAIEVGSGIVEMALCDAQHIGRLSEHPAGESRACDGDTHVGDRSEARSPAPRAQQDVPPSVRRQVMRRDGGRCVVPGCNHGTFLDLHHLVLRSEGGDHDPDTLVVLCGAHHRAEHRGQLIIEGRVSTGLVFRHADGSRYGSVVNPRTAANHAEAFRALRGLGFREGEVRGALDRVLWDGSGQAPMEQVLRDALSVLTERRPALAAPADRH